MTSDRGARGKLNDAGVVAAGRSRPTTGPARSGTARCSPAVERRARQAIYLLSAAEPGRRDGVVVRVDDQRCVVAGSSGSVRFDLGALDEHAPGDRPEVGGPELGRPEVGCAAALWETSGSVVLADLLAAGVTCLAGPPGPTARVLASMLLDLLAGRWPSPDELHLVGFGEHARREARVVALDSLAAAAARRVARPEGVVLVVVAPGAPRDDRSLARLVALATAGPRRSSALLLPIPHPTAGLIAVCGTEGEQGRPAAEPAPAGGERAPAGGDALPARGDALGASGEPVLFLPERRTTGGRAAGSSSARKGRRSATAAILAGRSAVAGGPGFHDGPGRYNGPGLHDGPGFPDGPRRYAAPTPDGAAAHDSSARRSSMAVPADEAAETRSQPVSLRFGSPLRLRPPVNAPVEVSVLGPVGVRGAEHGFDRRPTLTELVTYLALHPEGATTSTWSTAVWPERRVPMQTIANRLSEARRGLGLAPDGMPRLRRRADRHVLLDVGTDWDRFRRLARAGDVPGRRGALALVRGRPFLNLRSGSWTVLEGLEGEIVSAVTACARDLGEVLLTEGDADGASWAAHQGLRVAPWDERLHRLLMRAADAAGNRAGVEAVLRQLAALLELDGDPLRGVHPETAELYLRLARPQPRAEAAGRELAGAAVRLRIAGA